MKTTLIIGIALVIAIIAGSLYLDSHSIIGFLAFAAVIFQVFAGFYYEGKKSLCHAFIGPVLLIIFIVSAGTAFQGLFIALWLGSIIYLGYKAETTSSLHIEGPQQSLQ